jgi:hypothetical protein
MLFATVSCDDTATQNARATIKQQELAAGMQLIDAEYNANLSLTVWLESIKDEESAKLAFAKFDQVHQDQKAFDEVINQVKEHQIDADDEAKLVTYREEKWQGLEKRLETAKSSALDALGQNRELLVEFIEKMKLIGGGSD